MAPNTSNFSKKNKPNNKSCTGCNLSDSGDQLADQYAQCAPSGNALVVMGPDPNDAKFKQAGMNLSNGPFSGPMSLFYVVIHGDPCGYKIYCQGKARYISAGKLAALIKKCKGSNPGLVLTIGCRTANKCKDPNSPNYGKIPAQDLAKALGEDVMAPLDSYGIYKKGIFGTELDVVRDFGAVVGDDIGHRLALGFSFMTIVTGGLYNPFPGSWGFFGRNGTFIPVGTGGGTLPF